MPSVSVEAIVLQTFAYSETSKILRLYTAEYGLQSAIARGALRPRSRYGGVLEPFTDGTATILYREGRDLHTMTAFELGRSRQGLGRDLFRFGGASLVAEIVVRAGSGESDPDLFLRLRDALDRLDRVDAADVESVAMAETWALVDRLGFAPSLETCVACGRPLADDEDAFMDFAAGGVRCAVCPPPTHGRDLPAAARATLVRFRRGEAASVARTAAHWALLRQFLAFHVLEGGELRSLRFLAEMAIRP